MKKLILGLFIILILGAGALICSRSRLPDWIASQLKATVNNEFLKGTRAELTDLRFEADLWSFLWGNDGKLSFRLIFGDLVVLGQGAIKIHLAADKIQFQYVPEVSLRNLSTDVAVFEPSLKVAITGNIPTAKPAESVLGFQLDSSSIRAPQFFLQGDIAVQAQVSTKDLRAQIQGKKIALRLPTKDLVECADFDARWLGQGAILSAEMRCREILAQTGDEGAMLLLKNQHLEFQLDSKKMNGEVRAQFGDAEALIGPVMFQTDRLKAEVLRLEFDVGVGEGSVGLLNWGPLQLKFSSQLVSPWMFEGNWRLKPMNLNPLVDPVIDEIFKKKFKATKTSVQGAGVFLVGGDRGIVRLLRQLFANFKLKLSSDVESQKSQWRAIGIGVDLQSVRPENDKVLGPAMLLLANLKVDDFGWRGVGGRIYPSQFEIQVVPADELSNLKGTAFGELKVAMKEIDARVAPIQLLLDAATSKDQTLFERLHLLTALKASAESVSSLFEKVCLPWPTQWKTSLALDWKEIELKGGNLKIDGESRVEVIGGKMTTGPVSIENVLSSARITRFSTWVRGLQLRDLGAPIDFGEMDGVLKGDLEDVEMLGFVPRRYRARFELLPNEKKEVVFSAIAMKNFVSLFTPEDFSGNIPGPLREIAFGWLSRVLGGYNIKYAGLSLNAIDDSILLETLDPEAMVKRDGQRYLLYGTRFKIPLKSSRYPVVLDAPGLTNFVLHVQSVLSELSKKAKPSEPEATKGDNDVSKNYCNPDSSNPH